ncbi:MAG: nucleotidyltransferase domain-containing protein [Anaerolineales bacterium]|jgi:predicted nucleotidyltransferase
MKANATALTDPKLKETLQKTVRRIVEGYQPEKIILFGSYAYGHPRLDSDLDLLIIKQTDERPIDRRIAVRMLLRPLKLHPVAAPIVVTRDEIEERLEMGDPFAEEIVTRGQVLYEQG